MKNAYYTKKIKNNKYLPDIHSKLLANINSTPHEKSILQEIKDIDDSLLNKEFTYHSGILFSDQITPKAVEGLHSCLKKHIIFTEHGFHLWNPNNQEEQVHRLSSKVETFNEKIINLSKKNVYEFQMKKYVNLIKNGPERWSLSKNNQVNYTPMSKFTSISKISPSQSRITDLAIDKNQYNSIINKNKATAIVRARDSASIIKNSQKTPNLDKRRVITEVQQNPQDEKVYSKKDLKTMLRNLKEKLVFIWLPPTNYPHFNGMFTYVLKKKKATCFLKKYFFFRHGLSKRLFYGIFEHLSFKEDLQIDHLELITNKSEFTKIYAEFGWKMKSAEGSNKIRVRLERYEG